MTNAVEADIICLRTVEDAGPYKIAQIIHLSKIFEKHKKVHNILYDFF